MSNTKSRQMKRGDWGKVKNVMIPRHFKSPADFSEYCGYSRHAHNTWENDGCPYAVHMIASLYIQVHSINAAIRSDKIIIYGNDMKVVEGDESRITKVYDRLWEID